MKTSKVDLYLGDCLDVMASLPPASVDMVFCDLPYGVTACAWDSVIPFDKLWAAYGRVVKERGAIVLTATQPFTSALVMSNPKWFRHEWMWDKVGAAGFQIAKFRPMQQHEHILVFSQESPRYFPIVSKHDAPQLSGKHTPSQVSPIANDDGKPRAHYYKHPRSFLTPAECNSSCPECGAQLLIHGNTITVPKKWGENFHPSEKPLPLMAYLIQTYSRPGDTVLDNTMGSGSTGVAAVIENRNFIGIELTLEYFTAAARRIEEEKQAPRVGFDFGIDSEGVLMVEIVEENQQNYVMEM